MKKIILIGLMTLILPMVIALDMCGDQKEINTNCTMLTPSLTNCSVYNYTIIDVNGTVVEQADLSVLYGDIYQLNITQGEGDYIVRLCDASTREIRVKEDDNKMVIIGLIMLPMLLGFLLMLGVMSMGEDHEMLKFFLFLLCVPLFFLSMHIGLMSVVKFYDFPELQDLIGSSVYWIGVVFAVIIMYFLIYFFIKMAHIAAQKKDEKINY